MTQPIPDSTRDGILADLRARELSRNQIAKRHNVAPGTVSNVARRAGIKFLTAAEAATPGSTRAKAAQSALDMATETLALLRSSLSELEPGDLIRLYAATTDRYIALVGGDGPGLEHATSLLEGLAAQLHNPAPTDLAPQLEATRVDP